MIDWFKLLNGVTKRLFCLIYPKGKCPANRVLVLQFLGMGTGPVLSSGKAQRWRGLHTEQLLCLVGAVGRVCVNHHEDPEESMCCCQVRPERLWGSMQPLELTMRGEASHQAGREEGHGGMKELVSSDPGREGLTWSAEARLTHSYCPTTHAPLQSVE